MRRKAWDDAPFLKSSGPHPNWDWDPDTNSYPATRMGVCRHKVAWLAQRLGGVPLYGRRTDGDPGMHCVLWLRIGEHGFVVDRDGIWPEQGAPFVCDASHRAYRDV